MASACKRLPFRRAVCISRSGAAFTIIGAGRYAYQASRKCCKQLRQFQRPCGVWIGVGVPKCTY